MIAALFLAAIIGFAAQRGTICVVKAVEDVVTRRDARLFLGFFECALWAFAATTIAAAFGIFASTSLASPAGAFLAAFGGAIFGLGASVNGGCALGSAARLARGEVAFLAMPLGFILGAAGVAHAFPIAVAQSAPPSPTTTSQAAILLAGAFLLIQTFRFVMFVRRSPNARRLIAQRVWPVSAVMAAIGVAGSALSLFAPAWAYTALLVDVGAHGVRAGVLDGGVIYGALLSGAALSAWLVQRLRIERPTLRHIAEKILGGAAMGAGAVLIPGGNDALLLHGLPHLIGTAMIAYTAMSAAIALSLVLTRGLTAYYTSLR